MLKSSFVKSIVAVGALLLAGCDLQGLGALIGESNDPAPIEPAEVLRPAELAAPTSTGEHTEYPGIVASSRTLVVVAPQAGVVDLRAVRGDPIDEAQPVARLDNPDLDGDASMARASLAAARAERGVARERARQAKEDARHLAKLGEYASGQERRKAAHDQAVLQAELRASTARVERDEAGHDIARVRRESLTVQAPFDAVVADVLVEPGARVPAGTPLMRLVAPGRTRLRFAVPESEGTRLHAGLSLAWRSLDGHAEGTARVQVVAAEVDADAGVLVLEAELPPGTAADALPSGAGVVVFPPR